MDRNKIKDLLLSAVILTFLSLSLLMVFSSKTQSYFSGLFQNNSRIVLAQIETDLEMPNKRFKIVKVKDQQSLWLEFYNLNLSEDRVAAFKISSKFDGQMFVGERASSLFVSDLDGDQILEIIAPSYDRDMKPKISTFKYNPITDSFSRITNQELFNKINM
jgi:hypothetical protein